MTTAIPRTSSTHGPIPPSINTPCEFVQTLMKLQRAAQLITSSLDLDALLERVVNDIAASIGCVEVAVWLRDPESEEMVLHGVRGCTLNKKGSRLRIGEQGMVGHVAAAGVMHYARDVRVDPYYLCCEEHTLSEVTIPLKLGGDVIGVLSVDHNETDAFSDDQLQVFQALAGHIAVAIENTRLFRRERAEREKMEKEADDARALQSALFLKPTRHWSPALHLRRHGIQRELSVATGSTSSIWARIATESPWRMFPVKECQQRC